jgi:hypothetical protein
MTLFYVIKDCGYSQAIFGITQCREEAVELWRKTLHRLKGGGMWKGSMEIGIEAYTTGSDGLFENRTVIYNCVWHWESALFNALLPICEADTIAYSVFTTPLPDPQS